MSNNKFKKKIPFKKIITKLPNNSSTNLINQFKMTLQPLKNNKIKKAKNKTNKNNNKKKKNNNNCLLLFLY